MLRVLDCVNDFGVPQPTEWERVTDSLNSRCCRRFRWRPRRQRRHLGFESDVGRVYPPSLFMNGYLLPRCRAARDALGAEQYTARVGFKLRNHLIIRAGSLADIQIIALGDADDLVCGSWRRSP